MDRIEAMTKRGLLRVSNCLRTVGLDQPADLAAVLAYML